MGTLWQDLHFSSRMLRRKPGFKVVVALTLALGIGANTAIFSLINAVLLKSLPVCEPERLFVFGEGLSQGISTGISRGAWQMFSYPLFVQFQKNNQVFEDLCAVQSFQSKLSVKIGEFQSSLPENSTGTLVSGNYFSVLGVTAFLGRTLSPQDNHVPGGHSVAVISYRYWSRKFAQDPLVVGKVLEINGTAFTIVGVTPPEFFGERFESDPAEIWMPLMMQQQVWLRDSILSAQDMHWLDIIGRLRSNVSVEQAQANLTVELKQFLLARAGSAISEEDRWAIAESRIELHPAGRGLSELRGTYSKPLRILMVVVALVLLISCANIANLLLARSTGRRKEISVRLAMGATRARLIRQLITRSSIDKVWGNP